MKPLVSAIIPNYNYAQYIGEAVESALAQTYSNLEVIVVDDGSTDNSLEVLEPYRDRITIVQQLNSGVCVARNRGVMESHGDFIAFLDADDAWMPQKIEKQLQAFAANGELGLVHVGVREVDSTNVTIRERLGGMSGFVAEHLLAFESEDIVLGGGSGLMIPRKIFENLDGFDTAMSTSADWDLFFRVAAEYPIGFIPELLVKYRFHGSNMHSNVERFESEMLYAFDKIRIKSCFRIHRKYYGNLHRVLAGSYFNRKKLIKFAHHTVLSLWKNPANIAYFLDFPFRRLRRGFVR